MKRRQYSFIVGIVVAIVVVVGGVYLASGHLASANDNGVKTCQTLGAKHYVEVKNNAMVPAHTNGKLCDTLTITNTDKVLKLIAFGPHEHHTPYDGVTERLLSQGQSLTITFDQTGTYHFHDHLQDIAQGTFTVSH